MSGTTHLRRRRIVARRRLRIETADLGDHLGEVVGIDAADRRQPPHLPSRQQIEIVEQRRHRRIQPIALGELRRQAFLQIAREQPDRIEPHHPRAHRLDTLQRNRHRTGDRRGIRGQPPGRAQQRDQMRADHAIDRIGKRQPQLLAEIIAQRAPFIGHIVDAAFVGVEVARAASAGDRRAQRCAIRHAAGVIGLGGIGIERRRHLGRQRVRLRELRRIRRLVDPFRHLVRRGTLGVRQLGALVALEQRVPLQLLLDEARHLDVGILQQLDRLTQLRRHHQGLRLAKIEARP